MCIKVKFKDQDAYEARFRALQIVDERAAVKSVNGVLPDEAGAVTLTPADINAVSAEDVANIRGTFRINVTYSDDVYSADKTFSEIKAAYDAGQQPFVVLTGGIFDLVYTLANFDAPTDGSEPKFVDFERYLVGDGILETETLRIYSYTTDSGSNIVKRTSSFDVPSGATYVKVNSTGDVISTVNGETYADIQALINAGKLVVVRWDVFGDFYYFDTFGFSDSSGIHRRLNFHCVMGDIVYTLTLKDDNTWFVSMDSLQSKSITDSGGYFTTDTVEGALQEIGAGLAGTYSKPIGGIPKADLAEAVQTSLSKADTALQSHQSLAAYRTAAAQDEIDSGKVDKENGKGLSSNDYTAAAKAKVDAIPANPKYTDTVYDDTAIKERVATIEGKESTWDAKSDFSGSYNDLTDKPTIPAEVTPLIGTTAELTPKQVYDAVSAGVPVKVQYTDSTYGLLSFTAFNVAESMNVIVSQTIVHYNEVYILAELNGSKSNNSWGFKTAVLAEKIDIPDIPEALPNPHAITFTGAVTGSYDGSAALTVNIPSSTTYMAANVKDYGAIGDGVVDDTVAFQTALASNRCVYVPGGTYKLSGALVIRDACSMELSTDAVLDFTMTSGKCISMKMSACLRGNHAVIRVPYEFNGDVIYVASSLDDSVVDVPPYEKWDPQWKTGRYITDVCVVKPDSRGFHYSVDGECSGTAVYIEADSGATSTFIWGLNASGLRIAGAFSYGIHAKMIGTGWCHEARIEAFIDACEIGVCMEDCNNAYVSAAIQPRAALTTDNASIAYAKHGIQLIRSRNTDLSGARVWDWNSNNTLWTSDAACIYQHISMIGNCSGTILNDFLYYEMPSYDIRALIYTDTPSNLEKITILQEPFTRWFKPSATNAPMFFNGSTDKELLLKENFDALFQTSLVPNFDNKLPKATADDGSVFNGIGYKSGCGWDTDGTLNTGSAYAEVTCTGFIPCSGGAVIRLKGMSFAQGNDYCRVVLFKADKSRLMSVNRGNLRENKSSYFINNYSETDDGCQFTVMENSAAYFKINVFTSTIGSDPAISVNEEITYSSEGFLSDGIKVKETAVTGLADKYEQLGRKTQVLSTASTSDQYPSAKAVVDYVNANTATQHSHGNKTVLDGITAEKIAAWDDNAAGATFTPSVSADGTLAWTNDKGLTNPDPVNIKGPQGDTGPAYVLTDADKTSIKNAVIAALPVYDGGVS